VTPVIVLALSALVVAQPAEVRAPVGVVLTSRRPNTDTLAPKVAARVFEVAKREGIAELRDDAKAVKELKAAGFSDPRTCNGGQACSAKLAVLLGAKAVLIAVDVGKVGSSLAIHLEAFASDLPDALATADLTAREDKWGDQSLADITTFVRKVKEKLPIAKVASVTPPPPPPVEKKDDPKTDQPTSTTLTPKDSTQRTDLTSQADPAPRTNVGGIAMVVSAGALGATAAVFGVLAALDRAKYDREVKPDGMGNLVTNLTQDELTTLSRSMTLKFWTAIGCLAGAAVLGLVGGVMLSN